MIFLCHYNSYVWQWGAVNETTGDVCGGGMANAWSCTRSHDVARRIWAEAYGHLTPILLFIVF